MTITFDQLVKDISDAYSVLGTWQRVGELFRINRGLAFRIVKERHEPTEADIRHTLNLPVLIPTPACPICGTEVHHLNGVCPHETAVEVVAYRVTPDELKKLDNPFVIVEVEGPPPKRRKSAKSRRVSRKRASINTENPASAAATITKHMDASAVSRLIDELVIRRNGHSKGEN